MVELDKILSERSDERVLKAVKEISDSEFTKLVESILGYLEMKEMRSRPKGTFVISECIHRPDGKKYVVFFSRRDELISKADIESLLSYMARVESPNGLVLTTSAIDREGVALAESNSIGLADGTKLAALLRRFDLDKEVIRAAELWKERVKVTSLPGGDRQLEEAMRLGYESLASKDFMKALDHFDRAIMLKEDYDVPWRLKGNTLDEMGYHEQALECYKHALELFPESDETWFSLGSCLFSLGRYAEEISCYDRALQYNPVMQKALINRGSTLHRLGRFKEALETYDKVLKVNYRLEKVHNNRGATLHSLGQLNEALASYNRAIELKHDYAEAWMNKGNLLYEMGRYTEAFEAFTQMTQIRPELPKGWYLRGLAARKTGNISAAKASFEGALRLDPEYGDAKRALDDVSKKIAEKFTEVPRIVQEIFSSEAAKTGAVPAEGEKPKLSEDMLARVKEEKVEELAEELYGDRAELLLLLGKLDEAFDFLGKSLRLEGENAALLTSAGNVLFGLGKTEAAARTYEHALAADPSHSPAIFNLHTILVQTGEHERAAKVNESLRKSALGWQGRAAASLEAFGRRDFKQALEDVDVALALEDLAALQNYKGLLKIGAGDLAGAAEAFEKTKVMPLDQSEAHNNSGVVLFKRGDLEAASLEFDKSIRLQRTNNASWNNRGCVLYKLERLREAIACFEESTVMYPTSVAMSNKGFSQLALDLLNDALQTFENSLRIAETAEAYNNKGIVLERMGRHDDALVAFREALRLAPQFKDPSENIRRVSARSDAPKRQEEQKKPAPAPPGEEVVGGPDMSTRILEQIDEGILREKRKSELEAICESLGLSPRGTRADLIVRILKAKKQLNKR
jgi:superkiller protein 3